MVKMPRLSEVSLNLQLLKYKSDGWNNRCAHGNSDVKEIFLQIEKIFLQTEQSDLW